MPNIKSIVIGLVVLLVIILLGPAGYFYGRYTQRAEYAPIMQQLSKQNQSAIDAARADQKLADDKRMEQAAQVAQQKQKELANTQRAFLDAEAKIHDLQSKPDAHKWLTTPVPPDVACVLNDPPTC